MTRTTTTYTDDVVDYPGSPCANPDCDVEPAYLVHTEFHPDPTRDLYQCPCGTLTDASGRHCGTTETETTDTPDDQTPGDTTRDTTGTDTQAATDTDTQEPGETSGDTTGTDTQDPTETRTSPESDSSDHVQSTLF